MASIFEKLWRLGPAALVVKAIVATVIADGLLLAFILLRRAYRRRYFAKRDARVFEWRQKWDALLSGKIPYQQWRNKRFDRRIIETMVLDAFEAAPPAESARLLNFLRASGLIEKRIFEARRFTGWRRMRALVALGRTRAPEGIPALAEALRDRNLEVRLAALRGLGRTACPQAAEEILAWLSEAGLSVPALPLQSALVQCCAERPQLLVPYVQRAKGLLRETLGRVLGEVATPSLGLDLLPFAADELDELRAAAARAMSQMKSPLSLELLAELARDRIWFVRLRAIVSLGKLSDSRAIPALLRGLKDSNRLVRLRAAEALIEIKAGTAGILRQVVETRDRYAFHAYLTALENANRHEQLQAEIRADGEIQMEEKALLLTALRAGTLPAETSVRREAAATLPEPVLRP
jgi:HEAT repeat protein